MMIPTTLGTVEGTTPFELSPPAQVGRKSRVQRVENQEEVNMKKTILIGALTAVGLAAGAATAATLDDVIAKGELSCGVSTGVPGFAFPDANGVWTGFDVDICRTVAAAVLNDSDAIKFVPLRALPRWHPAKSICWHVTPHGHSRATWT